MRIKKELGKVSNNPDRIAAGHAIINPMVNKVESLTETTYGELDLYMTSDARLDSLFSQLPLGIDNYLVPYRLDRNGKRGGIIHYIRAGVLSKTLHSEFKNPIQNTP